MPHNMCVKEEVFKTFKKKHTHTHTHTYGQQCSRAGMEMGKFYSSSTTALREQDNELHYKNYHLINQQLFFKKNKKKIIKKKKKKPFTLTSWKIGMQGCQPNGCDFDIDINNFMHKVVFFFENVSF